MIRPTAIICTLFAVLLTPTVAQAEFGFVPGKATATALNSKGSLERQAGAHPYSYEVHFELNTIAGGNPDGEMRDVIVKTPPGLVGNPRAIPSCPRQSFEGGIPNCLSSTQVGILKAIVPGIGEIVGPLYNLTPEPGTVTQFGFSSPAGLFSLQSASVLPEEGYRVAVAAPNLPLAVTAVTATIWGTPADDAHTPERGGESSGGIPSDAPLLPYLTLPTSCQAPPVVRIEADSQENPGVFVPEDVPMREAGKEVALTGCEAVPFSPSAFAAPTRTDADAPSGLGFQLRLDNEGLLNPNEGTVAETQPLKTEVTLPAGMIANPAAAGGLAACTPAQFKAASATDPGCPEASKLGTLVARTPLLEEAIEGSLYLATPHDNPFGSLLALYVVASVPERGVLVKQAGEVQADPATGQLTTTFDNLPPLPYSSFEVKLREGPRAPLITPRTCGTYTATAKLYPFSAPGLPLTKTAPFTISSGAGGAPCASSEAELPNRPGLQAGTLVPLAGSYAPFLFKVSRQDGDQLFSSLQANPPPGLLGRLAGVPYCPEAGIAQAQARGYEGGGALEQADPSCPAASQIGIVNAGAGAGPQPYYAQGKAYLAGPYEGAPLSLVIITPAIAGPFDLGTVVVRTAIEVDEATGQITAKSDPLPSILHGIPLEVRSAAVRLDRESFTINPTDCEPLTVSGALTSTTGATAPVSNRFQVGGCQGLGFKPALRIAFKGKTTRGAHPRLTATLTPRAGDANVSFAQVKLPPTAFLDQAHIRTICTRVQFAAEQCPAGSIYGSAEAITPLLGYPLKGNVYLRSSSHVLPDLVVAFKGPDFQPIKFALAGVTDSVHGALRNTFQSAPDAPVSSFRLRLFGGKRGLVVLTSGFCADRGALVRMRAHNGRELTARPEVRAACTKHTRKPKQAKGRHR